MKNNKSEANEPWGQIFSQLLATFWPELRRAGQMDSRRFFQNWSACLEACTPTATCVTMCVIGQYAMSYICLGECENALAKRIQEHKLVRNQPFLLFAPAAVQHLQQLQHTEDSLNKGMRQKHRLTNRPAVSDKRRTFALRRRASTTLAMSASSSSLRFTSGVSALYASVISSVGLLGRLIDGRVIYVKSKLGQ